MYLSGVSDERLRRLEGFAAATPVRSRRHRLACRHNRITSIQMYNDYYCCGLTCVAITVDVQFRARGVREVGGTPASGASGEVTDFARLTSFVPRPCRCPTRYARGTPGTPVQRPQSEPDPGSELEKT